MDTKAFFKLSYGLYIVSSKSNEKESGCVINTMTQVTSDPSQISITINKNNFTTELVSQSGIFNVSVLLDNIPMETIRRFGFQSGRDANKFDGINYSVDINNIKYPSDNIAATFSCQVKQSIDVGTHIMFIAEVQDAKVLSDEEVLTYANYHKNKKGSTPKSAPSYVEETTSKGWRCDVCGFIYEGDTLPDNYICPVCKVDASHFKKL